ncbi:MAG: adenylate/guanylate cyclase domain-containing protein [Bacteroidota bacterium]
MWKRLSPQTRRNIERIIPFGFIWMLSGWAFVLAEIAAEGRSEAGPEGVISMDTSIFIFSSLATFFVGCLVGALEMIYLEKLFYRKSFLQTLFYKFIIYSFLMLLIISITYPIAASMELDRPLFDASVWEKFKTYLVSINFLSTLMQMAFSLFLCFFYAGISENLGHSVLTNFFLGKYHRPKEEERIFMFLDMKSSTTIAEQLGHTRYFDLLQEYYASLSDAIIRHEGEVYQYVGDEIVLTWRSEDGIRHLNCIQCFFDMKEALQKRSEKFQDKFGVIPTFKAGVHGGEVSTGEIGALKKEIIFTGDVLNATARIQGLCNEYQTDLLISEELLHQLKLTSSFKATELGELSLRGKSQTMRLFKIDRSSLVK